MPFKNELQRKAYMKNYMRKRRAFGLQKFLNDISHCSSCNTNPSVFLTGKRIPVCSEHWNILADEPIEWTEDTSLRIP